jgi:hypothetical protein
MSANHRCDAGSGSPFADGKTDIPDEILDVKIRKTSSQDHNLNMPLTRAFVLLAAEQTAQYFSRVPPGVAALTFSAKGRRIWTSELLHLVRGQSRGRSTTASLRAWCS